MHRPYFPNSRGTVIFCVAGFGPAAEVAPWRVPKGATFRLVGPVGPNICVEAKGPKTIDAPSGSLEGTDASLRRADQLAPLTQGPPTDESVPPLGQTAGVGPWETNIHPAL